MLRRVAMCTLALLAMAGAARAASLCVNAPGVATLTNERGEELIPNGSVETVFEVRRDALYAAGRRGAYRLYDADGNGLGDVEFSMIDDAGDALVFHSGTRYGAMDAAGNVLLPAVWTQLTGDGEGGWLATDGDPYDEQADEIIHLEMDGTARRTGVFSVGGLSPVSCGRMPYRNEDGLWGAVDAGGNRVIAETWRYIGPFTNGVARASGPEGVGLIDTDGRTVIAPVYDWLQTGDALVAARDGDGLDVYSPGGGELRFRLPGPIEEFALAEDCLWVDDGRQARLYDAGGTLLAEAAPGTVWSAGERGQLIASDGEWGEACQWLVDPDGTAASGRFQQILPVCAGRYAWLEMDGASYYSAELDRVQKSWDYENRRYGLMDDAGRILLPARYREIRAVGEDRLLLVRDGMTQLADRNGAVLKTWLTLAAEAPSDEAAE